MPAMMTSAGSAVDFERDGKALDHVRTVPRHRGLADRADRAIADSCVVFGDDDDCRRHHEADHAAPEQIHASERETAHRELRAHAEQAISDRVQGDERQHAGHDQALVERAHDRVVGAELDEERADDRRHHTGRADGQRIDHQATDDGLAGKVDRRQNHGRNHGHRVGFEQVGGHAGAVTDVVADVVCNCCGVARVVLGNAGLNLADEIAADVRALGEDAAAETREDRDQRGAEAERDQRIDHRTGRRREAHAAGQHCVVDGNAEQRQASHQHAGDGAGAERHRQALGQGLRGGLRRAHVGAHRDVHADEAGNAREHRADQEADGDQPAEQIANEQKDRHAGDGDGRVLARQIGLRTFLNGCGDLLHAGSAGVSGEHGLDGPCAVNERQQSAENDRPHHGIHGMSSPSSIEIVVPRATLRWTRDMIPPPARARDSRPDHAPIGAPLQHEKPRLWWTKRIQWLIGPELLPEGLADVADSPRQFGRS